MQRFALILAAPPAAPARQGAGGHCRVLKALKADGEGGFDDGGTLTEQDESSDPDRRGI